MQFKYIDNHAHLNLNAFSTDYKEAIARATDAGVHIINVGTQRDTSKKAIQIAEETDCHAIVGLHPVHTSKSYHDIQELGEGGQEFTSRGEVFDFEYYKSLAMHPKVVGIGECGLDYYRIKNYELGITDEEKAEIEKQKEVFRKHIELALEVGKPLMLHIRASNGTVDAYRDVIDILKSYLINHKSIPKGDVHFFAGTKEIVDEFLKLGFTFSFTGAITYGKNYDELIDYIPLDRILSETDCPFVAPVPHRGKRNEPLYVIEVIKKIAEIKKLPFEEVAGQLLKNSKTLFNI